MPKLTDPAQSEEMIRLFRSGKTTTELSAIYGIGPGGVMSALRRRGIGRFEGGKSEMARQRRAKAVTDAAAAQRAALGGIGASDFDSPEEFKFALRRFREQRKRAGERAIGWELSFSQWWGIWTASGRWSERGRGTGQSAVMARRGDVGPYSPSNVYVTTLVGNFVESHLVRGHRVKDFLLTDPVSFSAPA